MTRVQSPPVVPIVDPREPSSTERLARPLRVTVSGPELFANRTVALLDRLGMDARRPRSVDGLGTTRSRLRRVRDALATDVFLDIYGTHRLNRLRIHLARMGVPTLIVWVGTDVLRSAPKASRELTERAWHWCVAPWLRDELAEVGIEAPVVRLTPPRIPDLVPAFPAVFTVFAYILGARHDLYGLDFVLELARRRPDVRFLLVGATPVDALPGNVKALGWVGDLDEVMAETTLYVRPTSHDGLSNLVLEALAHGRYVAWTYPFPGAERADTVQDAEALIDDLSRRHAEGTLPFNDDGRKAVIEMFEPAEVRDGILAGLGAIANQRWTRPPWRAQRRIALAALTTLRVIFRADRAWKNPDRERDAG